MDIEEKQAIKMMKFYQEEYRKQIKTLKENGEPEGYGTTIDTIKGRICNIQLVLNLIEKQESELEKKDKEYEELTEASKELCKTVNLMKKVINEMSNFINLMSNELVVETGDNNLEFCKRQKCIDNRKLDCEECIKEYFTKKVEKEGIKE